MLAAVLLREVHAPRVVHQALHARAGLQRTVNLMPDDAVPGVRVQHVRLPERALVRGLSAALRKEGGAVQRHAKARAVRLAGEHRGLEHAQRRILFVEFFGLQEDRSFT